MKTYKLLLCTMLVFLTLSTSKVLAQSGDQILDGIGETGLIARYVFNGDAKDWSRNNLHGEIHGDGFQFVDDTKFGKVLSLSEKGKNYILSWSRISDAT